MDSRKMEFDVLELVMTDVSKLVFVWGGMHNWRYVYIKLYIIMGIVVLLITFVSCCSFLIW
jgi:hypothetical protein